MPKNPLFSKYRQGENRVTPSMLAVFERIDLSILEALPPPPPARRRCNSCPSSNRPADVIARYAGIRGGTHDVTAGLKLMAPLVSWLSGRGGLVEDDRKSYRTWQYKGRQVLTLRMSASDEAELVAGVNYSDPKPGLEPVVLRLTTTMSDAQLALVQTAIEVACKRRDSGADRSNAEHLLQEQLRTEWKPLGLKAAPLREGPVRRPIGYGYIDLVGAGVDGRIHVIETKLGPFEGLVVQ